MFDGKIDFLRASFNLWLVLYRPSMPLTACLYQRLKLIYPGFTRSFDSSFAMPPTLPFMLMPLSLRMMTIGSLLPPTLARPSYARPPVSAPSPITAHTL